MSNLETHKAIFYTEGANANEGDACPYTPGTLAHSAWMQGAEDALYNGPC